LTFFHQPEWTSNSWREVLRSYASAFTADDDVSLVLWLDPAQGLTPADAGERITGVLEAMPIEPGSVPDLLLVPDELDHRGIDRLYASVDWVVPHGDLAQAERARRTGARILHQLGAAHWRAARCKRTTDAGVAA
jgi:hypothetical protein